MPMPQAPAPQQGAPDQGADLGGLIDQGMQILSKIGETMEAQGMPPQKMKQIVALNKAFQMFASGEADQAQAPQQAAPGNVPMEAGANPNARPAM